MAAVGVDGKHLHDDWHDNHDRMVENTSSEDELLSSTTEGDKLPVL